MQVIVLGNKHLLARRLVAFSLSMVLERQEQSPQGLADIDLDAVTYMALPKALLRHLRTEGWRYDARHNLNMLKLGKCDNQERLLPWQSLTRH